MVSQQLLLTIFLPLAGAIALLLFAPGRYSARAAARTTTLLTLFCAGQLVLGYVRTAGGGEFAVTDAAWLAGGPASVRPVEPTAQRLIGTGYPFGGAHAGGMNAAFADGSVRFLDASIEKSIFLKLAAIADGSQ